MIRTQIYIPETIHQAAKLLARRKNKSLAEVIREFIMRGIKQENIQDKKSLDTLTKLNITGGPKDLSSKMDKYLYQE